MKLHLVPYPDPDGPPIEYPDYMVITLEIAHLHMAAVVKLVYDYSWGFLDQSRGYAE